MLLAALTELGWSQSRLVREINGILGSGYLSRSTVAEWLNQGRVPRDPVPTVVAHVLSEATGREVSLDELWQGRAKRSQLWLPALDGIAGPWRHSGTLDAVGRWLEHGEQALDSNCRAFLSVWGDSLIGPVWSYLDSLTTPIDPISYHGSHSDGRVITRSMTAIGSVTVAQLRRLDDQEGGSRENLRFVHRYFLSIGEQVASGDAADSAVLHELIRLWMSISQIAGWMAFDAGEQGLAQRYFYSGLHAARSVEDRTYGAYLLAALAHIAIYRNKTREAVELANAATEVARNAPLAVRSLAAGVLAHAEALAGNAHGFYAGIDHAQSLIEAPDAAESRPDWLYWYGPAQSRVRQGHALLALARSSSRQQQGWLAEAARLLAPNAVADDPQFPREAVYNRVWLARSQLWRGEVDMALQTVRSTLVEHVVRPPRTVAQLQALDTELGKRAGMVNLKRVIEVRRQLAELLRGVRGGLGSPTTEMVLL